MSSHYTTVNNNYIIVNNIFNDCIINLCGFRFFWDTLCLEHRSFEKNNALFHIKRSTLSFHQLCKAFDVE